MRLLVIVNVFEPDLGGGVLFSDLCYGLVERGFDVTVRCAYPYYPEWRDKSGRNGFSIRHETRHGVRIERFGLYIPRDPNSLPHRLAYEMSFFASLLRRLPARSDFEAIMVFCPLIGAVAYAGVCKQLTGLPLWLNVQDFPAEAATAGGIGSGGWMVPLQDALFNRADVWSTISPAMVERLTAKRRRNQPLHYIPNWLHRSLGNELARMPDKTHRLPSSPVRLLYSGNLGTKQNLIELCRILHDSGVEFSFRIQAEGSATDELRSWLKSVRDDRFDLRGLTDEPELATALYETDLFVITERPQTGSSFIPSKLIPALAAAAPVLAVCDADSPLGEEMREYRPGAQFTWTTARDIPALIQSIKPERFLEWRRRTIERAAFYEREGILDRYARELQQMKGVDVEARLGRFRNSREE